MAHDLRTRVWRLLEVSTDEESGRTEWDWVDVLLLVAVVVSITSVVLESVPSIKVEFGAVLQVIDVTTVLIFSVEYLARLWACTADGRFLSRWRYITSFYSVIDLAAILPFYAMLVLPMRVVDLRFLRALRLMRFARVLKLGRYSESLDRLGVVFRSKRADLGVALFGVLVVLLLSSSLMYYVENEAQPESFTSIPHSMWWGITTLTTVGYGDMGPVTPSGKLLGGVIQILGIAVFALPAGIIASGYQEESERRHAREHKTCPHCGGAIE